MNIQNKLNFKIKNGLPTPESISQPLINLQSNDSGNVDNDHAEHNRYNRKQSFISDKLLSSIVNLSALHESNNNDNSNNNDDIRDGNDRNKAGFSLESSPMLKNDSRTHPENFEITLSKLIIRLLDKDKQNENKNNNDCLTLEKFEFDEILKNLKLSFLKIKQLKMSAEVVKLDNNNKIERLELERNLLLKEIEVIKKRSTIDNRQSDYINEANKLPNTPITKTEQSRKIRIIETSSLSPANKYENADGNENENGNRNEIETENESGKEKGNGIGNGSDTTTKANNYKENNSISGTTFFHYYSTNKRQGRDFNSVDNRRNKRKRQ